MTDDDLKKAQVGIVSMGYDGNHLQHAFEWPRKIDQDKCWDNELVVDFNTNGVSDGISNGTDGMRYSLVSRDIYSRFIEAVCGAQY